MSAAVSGRCPSLRAWTGENAANIPGSTAHTFEAERVFCAMERENSRGEIDLLVQRAGATYPIEVDAEENLRAKSLRAYGERHPETRPLHLIRSGLRDEGWMRNVPPWAVGSPACWA